MVVREIEEVHETPVWDDDELAAEWTLERSDHLLLANKAGPTRLGFIMWTFSGCRLEP